MAAEQKEIVYKYLDSMDFMTTCYRSGYDLIGCIVYWDRESDFEEYVRSLNLPFSLKFYEGDRPRC